MSCSFWLRRKKLAALKAKEAKATTISKKETVNIVTEDNTATDTTVEKPVKKAVRKNDNNKGTDK